MHRYDCTDGSLLGTETGIDPATADSRFGAALALQDWWERHVPAADLDASVGDMLKTLSGNGRRAMAEVKDLIRAVNGRPIDEAVMRDTAERIARARASEEGRERITAFLEKRKAGR